MRFEPLVLFLCAIPLASAQEAIPVHVRVLHSISKQPLDAVELRIVPANDQLQPGILATSNTRGEADFSLAPGRYIMTGNRWDLGFTYYGMVTEETVKAILLEAGNEAAPLEFLFSPHASASGFVRNELGDPIPLANVSFVRSTWEDGHLQFRSWGQVQTDERGFYSLNSLAPARYIVCAEANQQHRRLPVSESLDFQTPPSERFYKQTCAPGDSPRDAFPIAPSESARRDIVLSSSPAVTIRGRVNGGSGQGVNVSLRRADSAYSGMDQFVTTNYQTGDFNATGITSGDYVLDARTSRMSDTGVTESLYASNVLTVGSANIEVQLDLRPQPTVTLSYTPDSQSLVSDVDMMGMYFPRGGLGFQPGSATPTQPGPTYLQHLMKNDTCVTGATLDGRNVFRQVFPIEDGAHQLQVQLSKHCAAPLKVRAIADGNGVPLAQIAMLLSGTPTNPGYVYKVRADDDGEASFALLAPGRYLVWAWPYDETGRYLGPPDLASVAAQATEVEIAETESKPIEIRALTLEPQR